MRLRSRVSVLGILLSLSAVSFVMLAHAGNLRAPRSRSDRKAPYLLLVSFSYGHLGDFDSKQIKAVNDSPYQGIAIPLVDIYNSGEYKIKDFEASMKISKSKLKKDMWPWIFFNRFVGYESGAPSHSELAKAQYFRNIKGFDIYNRHGALSDFFGLLSIALDIAKNTGSPGIVIDPELYNNYWLEDIVHLSNQIGKPEEEVKERLRMVGSRIIDVADREYPSAVLWCLSTGLTRENNSIPPHRNYHISFTYIIKGMLERAAAVKSGVKIISGGEITLGYCRDSLLDLQNTVEARNKAYAEVLRTYPNLDLGGTIAPWLNAGAKKGWMKRGKCGSSRLKNLEEFNPLIDYLLSTYKYVWIYAAWAGGYDPLKNSREDIRVGH